MPSEPGARRGQNLPTVDGVRPIRPDASMHDGKVQYISHTIGLLWRRRQFSEPLKRGRSKKICYLVFHANCFWMKPLKNQRFDCLFSIITCITCSHLVCGLRCRYPSGYSEKKYYDIYCGKAIENNKVNLVSIKLFALLYIPMLCCVLVLQEMPRCISDIKCEH